MVCELHPNKAVKNNLHIFYPPVYVLDGTFERDCSVRIMRDGIVVFEGALASLRRFKDDVKEVRTGYECGFVFANFNDVKEGDRVEAFKMVEIPR